MPNKTIGQLPLLPGPAGTNEFAIWNGSKTFRVSLDTIKQYAISGITDNDIYVTGGTYDSSTSTITLFRNDGVTIPITGISTDDIYLTGGTYDNSLVTLTDNKGDLIQFNIDVTTNKWHVPSGTTLTVKNGFQSFIYGDLYVEGVLSLEDEAQLVVLNGDIILSGGTISGGGTTLLVELPIFDTKVVSGSYNQSTGVATFTNNSGGTFTVTGFYTGSTEIYTTGGTYNQSTGVATFTNNTGGTYNVSGFYTGSTEIYTTGGTYNQSSGVATFTNNTGGTYNVSGFLTGYTNFYTTGATLVGPIAYFDRTDVLSAYTLDLSAIDFTGNTSASCIGDLYVSNLHSCSPLHINPNDEGNVVFGSSSGVTINTSSGNITVDNLTITNGATNTYVLTSDASGNATWQAPFNTNLYNSDGTLTGSRTVTMNGNSLSFQSAVPGANLISLYGSGNSSTSRTYFEMAQRKNGYFASSVFFSTFSPDYSSSLWGSFYAGSAMLSSYHETPGSSGGVGNLYFDLSHYTGSIANKYFAWHAAPVLTARGLSTEMMRLHVNSDGDGYLGIGTKGVPKQRLHVSGNTLVNGTSVFSAKTTGVVTIYGSGSTAPVFKVQGSSGELFSITDSLTGSLFSVNDISGLPVLEAYSDNTILMGSYQAPSLNTTVKKTLSAGANNIYSIPTSAYTGAFFDYTLIRSTGARAGNVMSIWSGSSVQYTDTSTNDIGSTTGVTFSVVISGSSAVLQGTASTSGWTLKTIVRSI